MEKQLKTAKFISRLFKKEKPFLVKKHKECTIKLYSIYTKVGLITCDEYIYNSHLRKLSYKGYGINFDKVKGFLYTKYIINNKDASNSNTRL